MAGTIVLMGGNEFRRACEPMDRVLLSRLGVHPRVMIVPTAAARERPDLAAENGTRYFRSLGAETDAVMIVDPAGAADPALARRIASADLVYFTGGDPVYLLETLKGSPAWQAVRKMLKRGRMLAGSSAGAMICGGKMWAPGRGWREGLGLVPRAAVLPHHSTLAKTWNSLSLRKSLPPNFILLGIDEATALVGGRGRRSWEVIGAGEVVLYSNKEPSVFTEGRTFPL